jgi:DNA-directed RNA polymerase alpha subunit
MDPRIDRISETDGVLNLYITNANYSLVNAIRRTILSDIPIVCFKGFPYEENLCNIHKNTSNYNNEIIKHRITCIPVHLDPEDDTYKTLKIVIDKKNNTEDMVYVTTEDITIFDKVTNIQMPETDVRKIFPPNPITNNYIDIIKLKQFLSSNIVGEEFSLEAELSVGTAKENGAYNVVSMCSYVNTPDTISANDMWIQKEKDMTAKKESKENIEYAKKDWFLLDANRIFIENSFDFSIETIGVMPNEEIFKKACTILIQNLSTLQENFQSDSIIINSSISTNENCYEIILENIDHTIGKVIEFLLYELYYTQKKLITYCGFTKKHPHDTFSIIKVSFHETVEKGVIRDYMITCIQESIRMFNSLISNLK